MSKTWWGHYIIVDKGEEYIRFKDYLELSSRIDKAIEYIEKEMPYLQETDKEYEDVNGNTYFTYKEYDGKELLEILKGDINE